MNARRALALGVVIAAVAVAPIARAATSPTPYPGGTWSPPDAIYDVLAVKNVPVTMSDGVNLVVDIYYPATGGEKADGPFPVLLTQTPYTLSIGITDAASGAGPGDYFVRRGYIYASADVRGTGRSGGQGEFFGSRDAQDGVDLVDWAAMLDHSNGIVGLHGCSYLGHTQLYTAAMLGPGSPVKAMIPMCVSSDPYRDTYMENGVPAPAWEGAGLAAGTLLGPTIETYMVPRYLQSQAGGDAAYDGVFWLGRDHIAQADAIVASGVPALLWNGWDDSGFGGLELYTALQNAYEQRNTFDPVKVGDRVTGRYQLILGDWGHGGGLDEAVELEWYETWLKGTDTGLPTTTSTPAHVQDRVTHQWTNVSAYPFVTDTTTHRLGTGRASLWYGPTEVPGTTGEYPLPTATADRVVAGPSSVHVRAASSGNDIRLRAELFDVGADGTRTLVTWGGVLGSLGAVDPSRSWTDDRGRVLRAFYALTGEQPVPAGFHDYDIPLQPTLWTLKHGHHLVVRLATSADNQLCAQKMAAITTAAVGCRPRAAVQARLAGTADVIELDRSYVDVPLGAPGRFPTVRRVRDNGPTTLPLDW